MGGSFSLDVGVWAAVVLGDAGEQLGAAVATNDIPMQQRRRLPPFTRDVLRCALPLLREAPESAVVYAASHGDLESTVTLLCDLARNEVLSPSLFAGSVHNAPAGALSLCASPCGDHTALAGNDASLATGLTEAYVRLAAGETDSVILILAEARLPTVYAAFDDTAPSVFLAMRLHTADAASAADISVSAGRAGALAVVRALQAGVSRLRFAPPRIEACAA